MMHESNTYVPGATGLEDFDSHSVLGGILEGDALLDADGTFLSLRGFLQRARDVHWEIRPTILAWAEPGAVVALDAFEHIVGRLISRLEAQLPCDAVYLELHGAMVVEGYEDGELEIVRRVRAVVGELPLVISLDLHGNISPALFAATDGMVGYRHFPHTDIIETGARAFELLHWMLLTGRKPAKSFRQLDFLIPTSRQGTAYEPARTLYAQLAAAEQTDPELLSATLMLGFVAADVPDCGPSMFAYATTQECANRQVEGLYATVRDHEPDFHCAMVEFRSAVERALTGVGPVVLADAQDNPGGGGGGDTMFLARALLERGAPNALIGMIHDPACAVAANAAGAGAFAHLDVGGRSTPGDTPLQGRFLVERCFADPAALLEGPMMRGTRTSLGPSAVLLINGVRIVVTSKRLQCLDAGYFRAVGVDPYSADIIVLKSTLHYQADFAPHVRQMIMVKAPGYYRMNPMENAYQRLRPGMRLCTYGAASG